MPLVIEEIDADSKGPPFDQTLELHRVIAAERDPDYEPDTEQFFRLSIRGTETFGLKTLVGFVDDHAVGMALVQLNRLATNSDQLDVDLAVHPEHGRKGYGTQLLAAVLDVAEADGRTSLIPFNVNSAEAKGFWRAVGADQKSVERQSRLWLGDTDAALMNKWVADRYVRAGSYRLEHFRGSTPPEFLPAAAELMMVMNDAPIDELDLEDDVWTEDDIKQLDSLMAERGRQRWVTMAFGPNGEPAGFTGLSLQLEKPKFARQGNTAVHPAHRNRGIGRWIKADMWLRLRAEAPYVEVVDVYNAATNDSMLAINVAMGFKPLQEWGVWQACIADLRHNSSA